MARGPMGRFDPVPSDPIENFRSLIRDARGLYGREADLAEVVAGYDVTFGDLIDVTDAALRTTEDKEQEES